MTETKDPLAALLHEVGVGCSQQAGTKLCRPEHHGFDAARLRAAGVTVEP